MSKCKNCKELFKKKTPVQKYCMEKSECISAFLVEVKNNKQKEFEKECKRLKTEYYEKNKPYKEKLNEVKKLVQELARKRDLLHPCISCGTKSNVLYDGGHYFKSEIYFGVMFDLRNIHKQCRKCNKYLGGNEINYRIGLVNRYGEKYVKELEIYAEKTKSYKWSDTELIDIKEQIKQQLNNFK